MANIHDHNLDARAAGKVYVVDSSNAFDAAVQGDAKMIVVAEDATVSTYTHLGATGASLLGDYVAGFILPSYASNLEVTAGKVIIYL